VPKDKSDKLYSTLAEYLGCPVFIRSVGEGDDEGHLFYCKNADGVMESTGFSDFIANAESNKDTIHFAVFKGVQSSALSNTLSPYLKYFSNPLRQSKISIKEPPVSFKLPENLWIVVELADGERIDNSSSGILKLMTVLKVGCSETEVAETARGYQTIGYYQLDHFIQHRKGRFVMSEELWKKVDALEAFVNLYAPYHISNKQWLQMEKFLSVFTVEDDDVVVALDNAMARNLLAEITALLKNKIPTGEKDLIFLIACCAGLPFIGTLLFTGLKLCIIQRIVVYIL
jgi:hypothetical protein